MNTIAKALIDGRLTGHTINDMHFGACLPRDNHSLLYYFDGYCNHYRLAGAMCYTYKNSKHRFAIRSVYVNYSTNSSSIKANVNHKHDDIIKGIEELFVRLTEKIT